MFTTPCFFRKNTPELHKKLEMLGYKEFGSSILETSDVKYLCCDKGVYFTITPGCNLSYVMDCGTNEELFLAIAALRDDSDEEQYFTNGKEWRKLSKNIPWQQDSFTIECHKATVEELIEHFKD